MFDSLQKQKKLLNVWKKGKKGRKLNDDEQEIYETMKMHPEYHDFLDADIFDTLNKREKENPFFHVILHTLLKKQIDKREPGIVRAAYHHLVNNRGIDSHEAYHSLMIILADEMHNMMKSKGKFNMERYKNRIEKFFE